MNDLDFRKHAYCNPFDDTADFVEASKSTPERSRFVQELRTLDKRIDDIVNTTPIPADLADRLKQLTAATSTTAGNTSATVKRVTPRYMALAASLAVAAGLTLSLLPSSGPSAQDMEFHDHMQPYLYGRTSI